jgi:hypothetical protein
MTSKNAIVGGLILGALCAVLFIFFVKPSFLLAFSRAKTFGEIVDSERWHRKYNSGIERTFYKIKVKYEAGGKIYKRSGKVDKLPADDRLDVYYFPPMPSASFLNRSPIILEYIFWFILCFLAFCVGFVAPVMLREGRI